MVLNTQRGRKGMGERGTERKGAITPEQYQVGKL